jgi:hypothetical protein
MVHVDPGIVHQHVETAQLLVRLIDHFPGLVGIA